MLILPRRSFLAAMAAMPATVRAQALVRPRLFVNAARIAQLRQSITTTHAALWTGVRDFADRFASQKPPAYTPPTGPSDEQLWQRTVGNRQPFLALAYVLTGEERYLRGATVHALASCGYPMWGARDGTDLPAGHQLFGLAMVYDWLHDALPADARDQIRATLIRRGEQMFQAARDSAYWRNSYLQNHLWVNAAGLVAAALALEGEHDTRPWTDLIRPKFRRTESQLAADGASHEGVAYWSYGVEYMLKYWDLAAASFGEHLSSPWWKQTSRYRQYLALPRNAWTHANNIVDIADCVRQDFYGPDYLLRRLAAMYRDGHAQWLAAELDRAGCTDASAKWLNLLWYDPSVPELPPTDLPTLRHFSDLGVVSARSDWSGDESLVVLKCGPPLGHIQVDPTEGDEGSGHVHPDANHFVIFGAGEWLLRDDGYAWKQTDQHNTLLIDGRGQMGEGKQWFEGSEALRAKANPRILKAVSKPDLDEIAAEAAPIYPAALGLKSFVRRLYFLKPNVLIVLDDIETDRPRHLELRFHTEFPCGAPEDGALLVRGKKSVLRVELLTPEDVAASTGDIDGKDRDNKPMPLHTIRLQTTKSQWRNAVAFSWSTGVPTRVTLTMQGTQWRFRAGERELIAAY